MLLNTRPMAKAQGRDQLGIAFQHAENIHRRKSLVALHVSNAPLFCNNMLLVPGEDPSMAHKI